MNFPQIDFSPLADLPNTYRQSQLQQNRRMTLADLQSGAIDQNAAASRLMAAGDPMGMSLANLANNSRDFQFRQEEARRQQGNWQAGHDLQRRQVDATLNAGRVPTDFEMAPDGTLRPKKGGPADPEYIAAKTKAAEKPRQMSVGDVTKLQEEGSKFTNLTGFVDTFRDTYGALAPSKGLAETSLWVAKTAPEALTGERERMASTWWQGYDRFKNVVRNDLFGSALTAPEVTAFEKADINPSMQPNAIRDNLKIQRDIAERGLKRKAAALINEGYRPDTIAAAYGLSTKDLVQQSPQQQAPQAKPTQMPRRAPDGNLYIPDPNKPGKYLQVVQ